jgi:hypothetical protein
MSICKSVGEVAKWDGLYTEHAERVTEIHKLYSQASKSAITKFKNLPIVSDITSGAISRFQNKMSDKSPNFKRILKSKSQPELEAVEVNDYNFDAASENYDGDITERQFGTPMKSRHPQDNGNTIFEKNSQDQSISRLSSAHDLLIPGTVKGTPMTRIRNQSQLGHHTSRPDSNMMTFQRTPTLFKNLSLPKILKEQKRLAQMEKICKESECNPRFKQKVNLPALTSRDFIAREIIDKFNKDEKKCRISETFRYKRQSHDESVILNSTPAAYWPKQENKGSVLVPTMKIKQKSHLKDKYSKFKFFNKESKFDEVTIQSQFDTMSNYNL